MMDLKLRCEEMREFFDEKAHIEFDEVHSPMMPNKEAITKVLPAGTKEILDLGAGTGMELIPLFERFPDAHVTALDISPNMLSELKTRDFIRNVTCVCGDFFKLSFGSGFDAVISSAALHHFEEADKARLYRKAYEALKCGGSFINSDRYFETRAEQDENFRLFYENPKIMRHFDTPLCIESEKALLLGAGFTDFETVALEDKNYILMIAHKA